MTITLRELMESARESAAARRRSRPASDLEAELGARGESLPGRLREALRGGGISVIAEIKAASPVDGPLRADVDPAAVARSYEIAGAAAVSVLTEEHHFAGSLDDLERVAGAVDVPVLRKDFISERYQVLEAAVAGADAVLLIAETLGPDRLAELVEVAHRHGLDALVEVHGPVAIDTAVAAGSGLIGVNNRDLTSMGVDPTHALEVADRLPRGWVRVAESGIRDRAQILAAADAGYHAVLVGSSLMTAPDPAAALVRLLGEEES